MIYEPSNIKLSISPKTSPLVRLLPVADGQRTMVRVGGAYKNAQQCAIIVSSVHIVLNEILAFDVIRWEFFLHRRHSPCRSKSCED